MQQSLCVSIVGVPNVGKSSLLNRLLDENLAIVSHKPQTTRTRIMGVLTRGDRQWVFTDTPGWNKVRNRLDAHMQTAVRNSLEDVDAALFVTGSAGGAALTEEEAALLAQIQSVGAPIILVVNKLDLVRDTAVLAARLDALGKLMSWFAVVPLSVRTGRNVPALHTELERLFSAEDVTPADHFYFDAQTLTDQPERVLAAEFVREQFLRRLDQEVPHGVAVITERMRRRKDGILEIEVTVFCEKESHKGILVGKGGTTIKAVGIAARQRMERFFDSRVHLQTRVKVKEDWREQENTIRSFGLE